MVTFQQYIKHHRKVKKFKTSTPHFHGCPFKYGTCLRVGIIKPKKPNSAQRKIAKVRLCNERLLIAYIPGFGHGLQKNSEVMVRGGRVPDLPGCRYHILRGKKDHNRTELYVRIHRRSKFATKKPEKKQHKVKTANNKRKKDFLEKKSLRETKLLLIRPLLVQNLFN
jgi:small subunit ribosomal protein S12